MAQNELIDMPKNTAEKDKEAASQFSIAWDNLFEVIRRLLWTNKSK